MPRALSPARAASRSGSSHHFKLNSVRTNLNNDGLILCLDDLSDNTADGNDLITDSKASSHLIDSLVLLSLRSDHKKIHNSDQNDQR